MMSFLSGRATPAIEVTDVVPILHIHWDLLLAFVQVFQGRLSHSNGKDPCSCFESNSCTLTKCCGHLWKARAHIPNEIATPEILMRTSEAAAVSSTQIQISGPGMCLAVQPIYPLWREFPTGPECVEQSHAASRS
jgi:hypothetical protein